MAHYSEALPHSRFLSNPLVNKLNHVEEHDANHACTYGGIGCKTFFFLIMLVIGALAFFPVHQLLKGPGFTVMGASISMSEGGVLVGGLLLNVLIPTLAFLIRPLIPILGTLYCALTGYTISFLVNTYGAEYQTAAWIAFALTILIVAVMAILYTTRIIKVTEKFKAVMKILFFSTVFGGVAVFLAGLVPALQPIIQVLRENFALSIISSVVFIVIAALFLLVDFASIQHAVEQQVSKKYEWLAAFSLVFTVIWLYLKILNLVLRLTNKQNSSTR